MCRSGAALGVRLELLVVRVVAAALREAAVVLRGPAELQARVDPALVPSATGVLLL